MAIRFLFLTIVVSFGLNSHAQTGSSEGKLDLKDFYSCYDNQKLNFKDFDQICNPYEFCTAHEGQADTRATQVICLQEAAQVWEDVLQQEYKAVISIFKEVRNRGSDMSIVIQTFEESQKAWRNYLAAECSSHDERYGFVTGFSSYPSCKIDLILLRIKELRQTKSWYINKVYAP